MWFLYFFLLAATAFCQSRGVVTGQVTDSSKAAIPGAKVIVQASETGVEYKTTTNQNGYFNVPSLASGNFRVHAEQDGFSRASSTLFKLDTTATVRIDLVLQPAGTKQQIEVNAAPSALKTETSMVGTTVSRKEIDSLPLQGRNTLELALTLPGVMGETGSDEGGIGQGAVDPGSGLESCLMQEEPGAEVDSHTRRA